MNRLAVVFLVLLGCTPIRNKTVYRAEIDYTDQTIQRSAPLVRRYLETQCSCEEGQWRSSSQGVTHEDCTSAADWWVTYRARWAWHREMMRYNGSVVTTDPGPAPVIPQISCNLFPEAQ
jgi:hypothetical protein